jgi:hypothetical protein
MRWFSRYPDRARIEEALGIGLRSRLRTQLVASYAEGSHPAWCVWSRTSDVELPFKLYISLHPACLPEALPIAVEQLIRARVPSFKYGADVFGLLRPDKLIAYFEDRTSLSSVSSSIAEVLAGFPAQGVPFSCAVTADGILSWGMDPPARWRLLGWQRRESWRSWLTQRLAFSLVQAKAAPCAAVEPWRFAVERLRLDGIDPETWAPSGQIWNQAAGA